MSQSAYSEVIARVAGMVYDEAAVALVRSHGLRLIGMTWEDAARYKNSSVGPNISDMTIQVRRDDDDSPSPVYRCMPVIRAPNFSDRTGDVSPERFSLLVGNATGDRLKRVTLQEVLSDLPRFLQAPESWSASVRSLLAPERDSHVLVSAQACLLPIPRGGVAEFTPVLFNYQSRPRDPAVLTILASREGTSITLIDPARKRPEESLWGQPLYFNDCGGRCVFTARRLGDFHADAPITSGTEHTNTADERLGLVLLVQVPLKQRECVVEYDPEDEYEEVIDMVESAGGRDESDLEDAVVGHGPKLGPFVEIDGLEIERDERFPVRVTVQFYKATSNGALSEADVRQIADQLERVYRDADYVGSLVTEGDTARPTEFSGDRQEPADWWERFWQDYVRRTGISREVAEARLREQLGENFPPRSARQASDLLDDRGE